MKKAIFTIDGNFFVDGIHNPEFRWNGWACPLLPLESVKVLDAFFSSLSGEDHADFLQGGIVTVTDGVPHWVENPLEGLMEVSSITPTVINGIDYYDIGSCGWCWNDVDVPDFNDDEESHAFLLTEMKACNYRTLNALEMMWGK